MVDLINDFVEKISTQLMEGTADRIVLMGNRVLDPRGGYANTYGIYPETILNMSIKIIEKVRETGKQVFLVTLINDWKFFKRIEHGPQFRRAYWQDPCFDYPLLYKNLTAKNLLPGLGYEKRGEEPLGRLSEQRLHNQFAHFKERHKEAMNEVLEELSLYCDSQRECTALQCASEMMMALRHFYHLKIQQVIAFLPSECQGAIEAGIALTKALSDFLMPDLANPLLVDHYSFNSSQPQTIETLFEPNLPENRRKISHHIISLQ